MTWATGSLCHSFLAYLFKLGHYDSRCRSRFPGPSEGGPVVILLHFVYIIQYVVVLFPLPVHIMHVFLFICLSRFSFRFILFCVLRFIIISLLHFAAFASRCCSGTKNSMEILFFFFSFFLFCFVLVVLGAPKS